MAPGFASAWCVLGWSGVRCCFVVVSLCALVCCGAQSPVSLLEAEWQRYVERVAKELQPLKNILVTSADHHGRRVFVERIAERVALVESSIALNGEFVSQLLDNMTWFLRRQQEQDDGGDEVGGWVRLEDHVPYWQPCATATSLEGGYSTVDELLAHLYRDYASPRHHALPHDVSHRTVLLDAVRRLFSAAEQHNEVFKYQSILVLGSGTGGLLADLSSILPSRSHSIKVTATECSSLFAAVSATVLSMASGEPIQFAEKVVPWASNFGGVVYGDASDQFAPYSFWLPPTQHHFYAEGVDAAHSHRIEILRADALLPRHHDSIPQPLFDVVITFYFIDAATIHRHARGIMDVLDRIAALVRPGGCWINLGPMHYHRADTYPKLSIVEIQLYMEEHHAFSAVEHRTPFIVDETDYSRPRSTSLFINAHKAALLIMRKRA